MGWTWADTAQQLLIRNQGSEQLDLAQVDIGIFNTVAQAGVLADWNDILGEEYLKENFTQSALDVGNVDGKQLALPWSMASITMVYNPEILARAGWDTVPTTMEEFEQCLADVAALGEGIVPYGVSTKDDICAGDFMPWLWTFGGAIFGEDGSVTINSEAAVECVKWYQDMLAKGYIAMDTGRSEARQMFAQGKMAFYDDAVVAKGQAVSNGVAPEDVVNVCSAMPRPVLNAGDQPQSTMWGHMLVIFDKSEYKEQAADLALTLVSDDVAMDYFTNNGMPPCDRERFREGRGQERRLPERLPGVHRHRAAGGDRPHDQRQRSQERHHRRTAGRPAGPEDRGTGRGRHGKPPERPVTPLRLRKSLAGHN